MKRTIQLFATVGVAALTLLSCTTTKKTATAVDVANYLTSTNEADLEVASTRLNYVFRPTKKERRGGEKNVKACAVREALKSNGGGDVLVAPEFDIRIRQGLFGGKKIKEVSVSGYSAKYKGFHKVAPCPAHK